MTTEPQPLDYGVMKNMHRNVITKSCMNFSLGTSTFRACHQDQTNERIDPTPDEGGTQTDIRFNLGNN